MADTRPNAAPAQRQAVDGGKYSIEAHGAMGVQVGDGSTQINYYYSERTWADRTVAPLVSASGAVDSPYRGLSAFEERDAPFFFGRETVAMRVLERMSQQLDDSGLLMVSGASGAGKSSLLRAGVLPRIRGGGLASASGSEFWPCLLFTPGRAPLDELALRVASLAGADAAAVRRGLEVDPAGFALTARQAAQAMRAGPTGTPEGPPQGERQPRRLLLVIDQFEQLFTQCPDEEQRRTLIAALHAAATAGHRRDQASAALVVLGVRADFEARCADYGELADAVQDRYLVTPMTERQLRMAITEPAKKAGGGVEDDLVDVLLREVRTRQPTMSPASPDIGGFSSAGVLPLLSHALDQAWRNRAGDILTLADYERTGGIERAVAESAQRAYDHLAPAQQAAARQVFIRLTATGGDGTDMADRATISDLTDGKNAVEISDVKAVLEAFAAERLLTLASNTVEISHEVLLTAWPLLRDSWLGDTHADRIICTRLRSTAADWMRHSRDPSYLYSGSILQAANETAVRIGADSAHHRRLSKTERDFLQASDRAYRRSVRRRQGFVVFLIVSAIVLASTSVYALQTRQEAVQQRDVAVSRQLSDDSEISAETDPIISRLQSIAAWRIHPSDDARFAMLSAAAQPGIGVVTLPKQNGLPNLVNSVTFGPDNKTLATGSFDGTVRLWDVITDQQIGATLVGPTGVDNEVNSVAFSPDGKVLAGGSDDAIWLWNVATHKQIGDPITGHIGIIESVAFSPDDKIFATGSFDGTVRLWDVATHQQIGKTIAVDTSASLDHAVNSVAFSPDGKTLATGSDDHTVRLWGVAAQQQIGTPLTGHTGWVTSVAFSPDGKTLASGSADGTARLWNSVTHKQIGNPLTVYTEITSVAFSPDGGTLATGVEDHTVRLWNVDDHRHIDVANHPQIGAPLTGHANWVSSVAFSPNGKVLASGSADGTARLWDVASVTGIATLTGSGGSILSAAFSPNGKILATGSYADTAQLWDVASRRQVGAPLTGHTGPVDTVAFSPDGKTLATGSDDGTVRLWETATHQEIGNPIIVDTSTGLEHPVDSVTFSPDGKTLATGSADGRMRLWTIATHQQIGNPIIATAPFGAVNSVVFSPDGKTLANANLDGNVQLWNVETHHQMEDLTGSAESLAVSPSWRTLATGSFDGTLQLWDVATHQQIGEPITSDNSWITSVAFSPDGKTLATGDRDDSVRLWDVATHQQIGAPLTGFTRWVTSVAFSPDGKTLAGGDNDGTVRFWNVAYLTNTVPILCAATGRSFTRSEWSRYASDLPYQVICP